MIKAIRRVLSAAAAEMRLDRPVTDEDCQQVLIIQRNEGLSNSEIIASADYLLNEAETILPADCKDDILPCPTKD